MPHHEVIAAAAATGISPLLWIAGAVAVNARTAWRWIHNRIGRPPSALPSTTRGALDDVRFILDAVVYRLREPQTLESALDIQRQVVMSRTIIRSLLNPEN